METFHAVVFEDDKGTRYIYSDAAIAAIRGPSETDRVICEFSNEPEPPLTAAQLDNLARKCQNSDGTVVYALLAREVEKAHGIHDA